MLIRCLILASVSIYSVNLVAHPVSFSGFTDISYNYLVNSNRLISGMPNRLYDLGLNDFSLQAVSLNLSSHPDQGLGGTVNVMVGRDPFQNVAFGMNPSLISPNMGYDLTQLFVLYADGSFSTVIGKYDTLVGVEELDPLLNMNFSGSILATYSQPTTHTGIREIYIVNKYLSFTAGINDGWDNIKDWSREKTFELGASYLYNDTLTWAIAAYSGKERAENVIACGPVGQRNLLDISITWAITSAVNFIANVDYGSQSVALLPNGALGFAEWEGLAVYLDYKWVEKWRTALRAEWFYDIDGARTGLRQNWREVTFTAAYQFYPKAEIRLETRRDISNKHAFINKNGRNNANFQQSYAIQIVYDF